MPEQPATQPLSAKERSRFESCKKAISENLQACFITGSALIEIKVDRLYREEFTSFKQFCEEVYNIGEAYAYRLAEAAEVKEGLPKPLSKFITNEAQARELAKVPEPDRAKVIRSIVSEGESVTAATIKANAPESKTSPIGEPRRPIESGKTAKRPVEKPPIELDEIGTQIPADALPFWHRKQEVQTMLSDVSRIKCAIERAKADEDAMFGKVSNAVIADLSKVYTHLQEAKPYAVCTTCMGSPSVQPKGCAFCGNKGLISKWQWETQSRKEVKDIRIRAAAKR